MVYVLDASAMLAYLRGEAGEDVVTSLLEDAANTCRAHAVNVMEVFYDFIRSDNLNTASAAIGDLAADGVEVREDMDVAFWQDAGGLKAAHRISIADAFGLAMARRPGAEFVTADHHELDTIAPLGLCTITFIR